MLLGPGSDILLDDLYGIAALLFSLLYWENTSVGVCACAGGENSLRSRRSSSEERFLLSMNKKVLTQLWKHANILFVLETTKSGEHPLHKKIIKKAVDRNDGA
ncbi:hypothetical protein HMPREF9374_2894 [Desmospora sp. 8437]|nr:hypothetical protein HMPREF9374_2894 [Desmospora sp. 8437]